MWKTKFALLLQIEEKEKNCEIELPIFLSEKLWTETVTSLDHVRVEVSHLQAPKLRLNRGKYHQKLSGTFCLKALKIFLGEHDCVSENFWFHKILCIRRCITIFRQKFYVSHHRKLSWKKPLVVCEYLSMLGINYTLMHERKNLWKTIFEKK